MKLIVVMGTAVLSLSLGALPGYAQQEEHGQQEQKDQKEKPTEQKEKQAQPQRSAKPEEKTAQQENKNTAKPEEKNAQPQQHAQVQEQHTQEQVQHTQTTQHASNNGGGRIPDDRYRANFGQQHRFRVTESDYRGHRFQYGGYWFGFVGVWPSNWLYSQDVYVIDIDGVYYLCNPMYPGVNIALAVTL